MRTPGLWDRATRRRTVAALGMAAALSGAAAAVRPQAEQAEQAEEGVKTFEVTASRFKFEPAVLEATGLDVRAIVAAPEPVHRAVRRYYPRGTIRPHDKRHCSFCGKRARDVSMLFAPPTAEVNLCDECLLLCEDAGVPSPEVNVLVAGLKVDALW